LFRLARRGRVLHASIRSVEDRFVVDFDFAVRRVKDRSGEFYYAWGPLIFSLPLTDG
jgi:hypothetical protein